MVATLLSVAGYLLCAVCMMALSFLVWGLLWFALSSAFPLVNNLPDYIQGWIILIMAGVTSYYVDHGFISEFFYSGLRFLTQIMATPLPFAGYLVYAVCMMALAFLLWSLVWVALTVAIPSVNNLPDFIQGWIILIMTGVTSYYVDPALIFEFLARCLRFPTHMMATLLPLSGYLVYIVCMVALSCLVLIIAHGAIGNTKSWWPELIHTSIVGLTLRLLNTMWGSPFQKPSAYFDMFGMAVHYLIYIVYSMAVSSYYFGASLLLKTLVISLTFVLLDVFVKPASVSDMIPVLGTVATALLAFFFLVALSFVVFMFLHTWAEILLPSTRNNYPEASFVIIAGLTFMVMQTMLGLPVEEPSIFSDMKAGLLGITDIINKYQGAYVVIKTLTVLVIPLLSREPRPIMYTTAAFIVALSLLPPGPGTPTEYPASTLVTDDFVQKTITSFITSQISGVDGETKQLTDS